jgi:hypothetical protein
LLGSIGHSAAGLYSESVLLRIVALLLAIAMVGVAPHAMHALAEVASEVDELGDPTASPSEAVIVPWPDRGSALNAASRSQARGRVHTTLVFRPPRLFASR